MITRDLASLQAVDGFNTPSTGAGNAPAPFHSCTVAGFTSACAGQLSTDVGYFAWGGVLVDRLGLTQRFSAVAALVRARAQVTTSAESTAMVKYYGVTIGLQHSSSTCSGDFENYSTGTWVEDYPLVQVSTATSTTGSFYTAEGAIVADAQAALMSTALTSSTSTGYAHYAGPVPVFPLEGAQRYIRMVVAPHIEVTGCGSPGLFVDGVLLFGYPDTAPLSTSIKGRIQVTSACST